MKCRVLGRSASPFQTLLVDANGGPCTDNNARPSAGEKHNFRSLSLAQPRLWVYCHRPNRISSCKLAQDTKGGFRGKSAPKTAHPRSRRKLGGGGGGLDRERGKSGSGAEKERRREGGPRERNREREEGVRRREEGRGGGRPGDREGGGGREGGSEDGRRQGGRLNSVHCTAYSLKGNIPPWTSRGDLKAPVDLQTDPTRSCGVRWRGKAPKR